MTVISSIILDAYRESNILPLAATPTDAQNTEALRLYNAILTSLFGSDVGENLSDWPLGIFGRTETHAPAWDAHCLPWPPINSRLIALNEEPITVYFTPHPQEGARYAILDPYARLASFPVTLDGNGRTIDGEPELILNADGVAQEWFYRGDLGTWMPLAGKVLTDENPFPADFDAMFAILLALRLNPRYGRQLTDMSESILRQGRTSFIARYLNSQPQTIDDSISWPFLSKQGYGYGRAFSNSTRGFNTGRIYD